MAKAAANCTEVVDAAALDVWPLHHSKAAILLGSTGVTGDQVDVKMRHRIAEVSLNHLHVCPSGDEQRGSVLPEVVD